MNLRTVSLFLAVAGVTGLMACDAASTPVAPTAAPVVEPVAEAKLDDDSLAANAQDYAARDKSKDGSITGTVKFVGKPPPDVFIDMSKVPVCKAKHKTPPKLETVVVNKNGTLLNVFVYITKGAKGWKCAPPKEPITIDQDGCFYKPHVQGMVVGQPMRIKNTDGILHNIHSYPLKNDAFNFAQPVAGEDILTLTSRTKTFSKQEIVPIRCDVHGWMGTYVVVRKNPFFAVTDKKGNYTIKGVPPGTYELYAWHEYYGNKQRKTRPIRSKPLTVTAGKAVTWDVTFKK